MNVLNSNIEQVTTRGIPPGNLLTRTTHRNLVALATLVTISIVGVLYLFNPAQHNFYPICVFHELTGLLCPGCGSLRAIHQLLHGHFAAAFGFNPLLVLALPFLLWTGMCLLAKKAKNPSASIVLRPFWIWLWFAVPVAFGVLRNLPIPPFAWLAP